MEDVELRDGRLAVRGSPASSFSVEEIAKIAHHGSNRLPAGTGRGLEATENFDPEGTYSNAAHGAVVEVDPETGEIELVHFVVVEDCGVMINPMIVDGQVAGGVTQGIGSALPGRIVHDERSGQPFVTSLIDYLVPTATTCRRSESSTSRRLRPTTTGAKGMGEGGAIGTPGRREHGERLLVRTRRRHPSADTAGRHPRGSRQPFHLDSAHLSAGLLSGAHDLGVPI